MDCVVTAVDGRLEFVEVGGDTPLVIKADENGLYYVELEPGEWEVRGFSSDDTCTVEEAIVVTVESCSSQTVDVCANICFG